MCIATVEMVGDRRSPKATILGSEFGYILCRPSLACPVEQRERWPVPYLLTRTTLQRHFLRAVAPAVTFVYVVAATSRPAAQASRYDSGALFIALCRKLAFRTLLNCAIEAVQSSLLWSPGLLAPHSACPTVSRRESMTNLALSSFSGNATDFTTRNSEQQCEDFGSRRRCHRLQEVLLSTSSRGFLSSQCLQLQCVASSRHRATVLLEVCSQCPPEILLSSPCCNPSGRPCCGAKTDACDSGGPTGTGHR